jgi:hypothetical protein
MHLRRHEHETIAAPVAHPEDQALAQQVWRGGLPHTSSAAPLIRAPHAAELVEPAAGSAAA